MSQESQSDPSNHSDEHESEDILNPRSDREVQSPNIQPVPSSNHSNRPLPVLLYASNYDRYVNIGLPLYEASIKCDWKAAEAILDKNPYMDLLRCSITENGETALHIAASAKAPKKVDEFVRNLVGKMEMEDLELLNNNKSTALYLAAAAGNIETVKIMMKEHETLDRIPGGGGDMMPLYAAVLFGNKDVATYLYERSKDLVDDRWTHESRSSLLEKCVESDMFVSTFIGLKAGTPVKECDALLLLRSIWENILKHENSYELRGPTYSIESGLGTIAQNIQLKQLIFKNLDQLEVESKIIMIRGIGKVSKLKELVDEYAVKMHVDTQLFIKKENIAKEDQALELQKLISEYIGKLHSETETMVGSDRLPEYEEDLPERLLGLISDHIERMRAETKIRANTYSYWVMFIAAEVGNTNFLLELIRRSPDLIWKVNDNKQTIFHVAIKHRHEGIYNLIYEIGSMKDMVTPLVDKDGNSMLHLAAMRTRKKNLEGVSGAALQMQRELLWFKEVERLIPPYLRESKNKDGFTPRELFTIEHQLLIDQGEQWMKSTASQCMVVATLIATIVFAAAFTVPGGYDQTHGIPMFKEKKTFVAFVVADAVSLFLSSASILTFLSILTSRYAERDFVESLPMKLMLGLVTLFLSIGAMMVTFSVSFFVLYQKEMKWIPIFISGFAVIPAILYVVLQFHLLIDVVRSTYGGKYLFKPARQVLFYYEKPQDLTNISVER